MNTTTALTLSIALSTCLAGSVAAAEHRTDVQADWDFQHRYATSVDKNGKVCLRADAQPAPLVDEQAGLLRSDRDPTDQVARRVDALLKFLAGKHPQLKCWNDVRQRLDPLLAAARTGAPDLTGKDPSRQETYRALCALRREIVFANPLLDFDTILFSDETNGANALGRTTTGQFNCVGAAEPGGSLYLMRDWKNAQPTLIDLCKDAQVANGPYKGQTLAGGMFHAPSLTYDGNTVLFSWAKLHYPAGTDPEEKKKRSADAMGLFRIGVDGTGLRQLIFGGPHNDMEPCELPDERIAFMSSRRELYDRCFAARPALTLCSMKPDGSDILLLSRHETHGFNPSVANDGMILYSRWDYVDRTEFASHGLWTCYPDGRDARSPNGNYQFYRGGVFDLQSPEYARYNPPKPRLRRQPLTFIHVQAIPGSRKVMGVGSDHGGDIGPVLLADLDLPDDYAGGQIVALTPGVYEGRRFWCTPYPLSEDFFLGNFLDRIYLADRFGNMEVLYRISYERNHSRYCYDSFVRVNNWNEQYRRAIEAGRTPPPKPTLDDFPDDPLRFCHGSCVWRPMYARPLRARARPPIIPSMTFQSEERRGTPGHKPATITIANVYDTDIPLPQGVKVKRVRLVQVLGESSGRYGGIGTINVGAVKLPLGTVPVEEDGSVHCLAPIDKGFYFQLLDENGLAIQSMMSVTYVHAGERLSCRGCHESYQKAPAMNRNMPIAFRRAPSPVIPETADGRLRISNDYIKPAVARVFAACGACHEAKKKGPRGADVVKMGTDYHKGWVLGTTFVNEATAGRTTPDRFGARGSKIWEHLQKNKKEIQGLQPDDIRYFALWLDLFRNDSSYYFNITVKDAQGQTWPKHPDLDINNPLGLEIVPTTDNRQTLDTPGGKQ